MKRLDSKSKILFLLSTAFSVLLVSFFVYSLVTGGITFAEPNTGWDGVSVASDFSGGNGTADNPYLISTPEEFILFKNLIDGDNYEVYYDKHFKLTNDLDFNKQDVGVIAAKNYFSGNFNGNGYSLKNINNTTPITIDDKKYYGLFYKLMDANISNVIIENYSIVPTETNEEVRINLLFNNSVGTNTDSSKISNISFNEFNIDLSNVSVENDIYIIGNDLYENSVINNIILNGTIKGNIKDIGYFYDNSGSINNIISNIDVDKEINSNDIESLYVYKDNNFYLNNNVISNDNVTSLLNDNIDDELYWDFNDNNELVIKRYEEVIEVPQTSKAFAFSIRKAPAVVLHDSGIEGNSVYVNDLDMDYNNYMGLNYTKRDDASIPTGVSQGFYSSYNLAKVYIRYSGVDFNDSNIVGTVSTNEGYNEINYYKYYPIINGRITFDLIDNPFANRPNDRVFNGWVTDYEGAFISLDRDRYVRSVSIPADGLGPYSITFNVNWSFGKIIGSNEGNISSLDTNGIKALPVQETRVYDNLDLYYISGYINSGETYPPNAVNENGNALNGQCDNGWWSWFGCDYYIKNTELEYNENYDYYELRNGRMQQVWPSYHIVYNTLIEAGDKVAGYYKQVNISRNSSYSGYYDQNGNLLNGNCTSNGGCNVYQYLQYYDSNGNPNVSDGSNYYYLVTRDTNIYHLQSNLTSISLSNNIPVTITSIHNGVNSNRSLRIDRNSITAADDLRIEYLTLYAQQRNGTSDYTSTQYSLVGNYKNVKIGRGIARNGTYLTAIGVIGGGSTNSAVGSSSSPSIYTTIIESGFYRNLSSVAVGSSTRNIYVRNETILGNDIDRVSNNNNTMDVYFSSAGSWGGTVSSGDAREYIVKTTVKSGNYGTSKHDYSTGIYVGGRAYGSMSGRRSIDIEGGYIYNLIGGPTDDPSSSNNHITQLEFNIKGGSIDLVIGGAGLTETAGNRVINLSGGTINYSVFGGSNGYSGSNTANSRGTLDGDTFIYAGGSAIIGTANNTLFGAESGSIFGAGNGNNNYSQIGSANNSTIIIDGATINGNVYGGGNYGALGSSSNTISSIATIHVLSGSIAGNIYGAGNNNGGGSTDTRATNNIIFDNGTVTNIFGGSRNKGIVYGETNVTVNGGTVNDSVYGGGEGGYTNNSNPGTYVQRNSTVSITNGLINGNVYGGSAYGTVNATSHNSTSSAYETVVNVSGGTIVQSVFGGGKGGNNYTPTVVGDITVNITGGSMAKVFGGFDSSGTQSAGDVVYLSGGVIGNAFGGGNSTGQTTTDIRLQGATITENLYGGSNQSGIVSESHVSVLYGIVSDIYGGNNLGGSVTTTDVVISHDGGSINGDVYGGGNVAEARTTNVLINYGNLNDVYGGGYSAGVSTSTNIVVKNGTINNLFGGSNTSGIVGTTNISVVNSNVDRGIVKDVDVDLLITNNGQSWINNNMRYISIKPTIHNFSDYDYTTWTATVTVEGSNLFDNRNYLNSPLVIGNGTYTFSQVNKYDANQPFIIPANGERRIYDYFDIELPMTSTYVIKYSINATNSSGTSSYYRGVYYDDEKLLDLNKGINYIYGGNNLGGSTVRSNIDISAGTIGQVYGGGNQVGVTSTDIDITGGSVVDVFGGSNKSGNVTNSDVYVGSSENDIEINSVYGGNNLGGVTTNTKVEIASGTFNTVYGGGNQAVVGTTDVSIGAATINDLYGGGNAAGVNNNTSLSLYGSTINNNVYGGGNEGEVTNNTDLFIHNSWIKGNAFAGGNGVSAVVRGNSIITIDGSTEVGTESSVAPDDGCVFGSGNAAATGTSGSNNYSQVNIVGGIIHGNVYGGPKMSVVYGKSETNIGTDAVNNNDLEENDIVISGTVFGGGESNAEGSETYDWTFISVTDGIDVNINGNGYITNDHQFVINGSIFGSGNASSSSGDSNIYIKDLGSKQLPNKSISIQRANLLTIDSSYIELQGTTDRTNEYSDILYSFNMIDKMIIKNNTTLLLKHNANMLKELYSGVDVGGNLVKATVDIDDETKTVTKNVDNRIYLAPNQNLNISINQSATAYGRVSGMTFFGMYTPFDNGNYRYGLYDDSLDYGDSGNASLEIIGGSYVIGLRNVNHDITKDGFYSNYMNDDYTEVSVKYIEPSTIGETGYRWVIGFESISYNFTLTASKYSSLGTYELQLIDFADGNTIFEVIGFDSSGLNDEISLVDSTVVPRVGRTQDQANNILGLSMKSETQEWTGYGTTKLKSDNSGTYDGCVEYITDSRKLPPSLMFYLYHAKNINSEGSLGSVILTLRADVPKNEIEYDIKFITITIDLVARKYNDVDSYDASITYDRRYEMPSSTLVNITNQSQFTTYYSLIAFSDNFSSVYGNNNENYHVLTSNNPLPVNTMITMLDVSANPNRPDYYYFRVTQDVYDNTITQLATYNEVTYKLSDFIKMGSTSSNNRYNDSEANHKYYDDENGLVDEEFLFIFDFKECNVSGEHLNNSMLFELRNRDDRAVYNVLGIRQNLMYYNTYESSNVVLNHNIIDNDNYLYYNVADDFTYQTEIQYNETINRQSVIDTNYESSSLGINVVLLDNEDKQVSSSLLIGTSIKVDNQEYFADGDGVFRIKLANKVSNLDKRMKLTVNKDLPAGRYKIRYTLFASDDGLHNSVYENSVSTEYNVTVVSANNSIIVDDSKTNKWVNGENSLNGAGSNINKYVVRYNAELTNPNFRLEVYKRKTDNIDSVEFESVSFNSLFINHLQMANNGNEVLLDMGNSNELDFQFGLKDDLVSGTYKLVFKLYDNNQVIDQDVKYVIVTKKSD